MKVTKQYLRSLIRESLEEMGAASSVKKMKTATQNPKYSPMEFDLDDPSSNVEYIAHLLDKEIAKFSKRHPHEPMDLELKEISKQLHGIWQNYNNDM